MAQWNAWWWTPDEWLEATGLRAPPDAGGGGGGGGTPPAPLPSWTLADPGSPQLGDPMAPKAGPPPG